MLCNGKLVHFCQYIDVLYNNAAANTNNSYYITNILIQLQKLRYFEMDKYYII